MPFPIRFSILFSLFLLLLLPLLSFTALSPREKRQFSFTDGFSSGTILQPGGGGLLTSPMPFQAAQFCSPAAADFWVRGADHLAEHAKNEKSMSVIIQC
ncbi:hypothetical protein niasHT_027372 [Heterodera trifolii]|uniref:Uncharacterized protein n=1 Tax=Heterodera trifolii TaxID=157864 RepID=A0ABD2JUB2_9BILA